MTKEIWTYIIDTKRQINRHKGVMGHLQWSRGTEIVVRIQTMYHHITYSITEYTGVVLLITLNREVSLFRTDKPLEWNLTAISKTTLSLLFFPTVFTKGIINYIIDTLRRSSEPSRLKIWSCVQVKTPLWRRSRDI